MDQARHAIDRMSWVSLGGGVAFTHDGYPLDALASLLAELRPAPRCPGLPRARRGHRHSDNGPGRDRPRRRRERGGHRHRRQRHGSAPAGRPHLKRAGTGARSHGRRPARVHHRELLVPGRRHLRYRALRSAFRRGRPAAHPRLVLVVLHIPRHAPSALPGILDRSGPLLAVRDECALPTSPAAALYNTTQQALSRSSQRCTTFEPVSSPAYLVTKQVNRGTLAFSCTPKSMPKDHLT
jgi:hypothetical protein